MTRFGARRYQSICAVAYWVVVSSIFHVHPENWGRFPFWLIFFKGVETTNELSIPFHRIMGVEILHSISMIRRVLLELRSSYTWWALFYIYIFIIYTWLCMHVYFYFHIFEVNFFAGPGTFFEVKGWTNQVSISAVGSPAQLKLLNQDKEALESGRPRLGPLGKCPVFM